MYVIGNYPLLTTTFIDREIEALQRFGAEIRIVAMRRPDPSTPLTASQRRLADGTTYVLPPRWRALAAAFAHFALLHPVRFWSTLAWMLSRPHPSIRARFKTLLHVGEALVVADLVREQHFEEFHAHFADRAATIALVAGRLLDKPFSMSVHTGADIYVTPVLLREKLEAARAVATCTQRNRDHLAALVDSVTAAKIHHVRHGLDLDQYSPAGPATATAPVILTVGQLKPRKGILDLVEACAILRSQGRALRCEIVGDGPQRGEIESLVRARGLEDCVVLLGALSPDEVIARYRAAGIFVLPCVQMGDGDVDGIPNVLAEAMAIGLPVVSTALAAVAELVESGENGLLTEPGRPDQLADAIARLLDDADLRTRLGGAGRDAVIRTFDIDENVLELADRLWPGRVPAGVPG